MNTEKHNGQKISSSGLDTCQMAPLKFLTQPHPKVVLNCNPDAPTGCSTKRCLARHNWHSHPWSTNGSLNAIHLTLTGITTPQSKTQHAGSHCGHLKVDNYKHTLGKELQLFKYRSWNMILSNNKIIPGMSDYSLSNNNNSNSGHTPWPQNFFHQGTSISPFQLSCW
jgi:hypothetical protein